MKEELSTRRKFLLTLFRGAGVAAVAGVTGGLVLRADADKVWQLDPNLCNGCVNYTDAQGWARCATQCVLKRSAVRAVNDFERCGYCRICPGYHDVRSERAEDGTYVGRVCPQDAIIRKGPVGQYDPSDPNNWYYEYSIDETKCNGCGKCVIGCKAPWGNGSLRMEVRHNACVDCNSCAIAVNCPTKAFYRDAVGNTSPSRKQESH